MIIEETMRKNRTVVNMSLAWISQAVTVVSGLILPRLYLTHFGSETNGLIQSITQFLNFVNLLEGGLGSVFLASIYKSLANHDEITLSRKVSAAQKYFRIIAYIFIAYSFALALVYPLVVNSDYDFTFVSSLILILSLGLFVQFFFSLTYKLLLQGDRKAYIVLGTQILTTVLNVVAVSLALYFIENIHIVKLLSTMVFLLQPLVFNSYVKKHYNISCDSKINAKEELPERWASFGQNVAFFIHNNTDIALLSLFKNLKTVSVYSVHVMVVFGLKNLIMSFSQVFSPKIGLSLAKGNETDIENQIDQYEFISFFISTILFGSCVCLLVPFVLIYTKNITDVNYCQPIFAVLLIYSEYIYCIRNPYIAVVYGAGKFKETASSAYFEAGINIIVSLALIWKFGLIGIAIGTSLAMTYRWIHHLVYLKRHIVYRSVKKTVKRFLISVGSILFSGIAFNIVCVFQLNTIPKWILGGAMCLSIQTMVLVLANLIFDNDSFIKFARKMKHQKG